MGIWGISYGLAGSIICHYSDLYISSLFPESPISKYCWSARSARCKVKPRKLEHVFRMISARIPSTLP